MSKKKFVEDLVSRMTLEEKIGQCLTLEFCGTIVAPYVVDFVSKYHCAGLRITPHIYTALPYGTRLAEKGAAIQRLSPYAAPDAYAEILGRVQDLALGTRLGIPVYFSSDQEGDFSQDYSRGGVNLFPSAMGMAATGDKDFVYECYLAVARQNRAAGINMLHTPCLDVNINPRNPEICTRSFGDDAEMVAEYGLAQLNGFRDGGVVATGKHFPGRGDSEVDVHFAMDVNTADRGRLEACELYPYRRLIENGLPAVMTAHTIYNALDPDNPASVSRKIVTGLLREEMGFKGVITTDAIGMKGVISRFESYGEACAAALAAGNDLVLAKGDPGNIPGTIDWIRRYVEDGRISMEELDNHVRRVLGLKWDYGVFDKPRPKPKKARDITRDEKIMELSSRAAMRSAIVVRDRGGVLPVSPEAKLFFTDQRYDAYHNKAEDNWWHSHMMAEYLRGHSDNVTDWECRLELTAEDEERIMRGAAEADVVVFHSFYWRGNSTNTHMVRKVIETGKPVILVAGGPYRESIAVDEADCLIVTFGSTPRCAENAAALIYGKGAARGKWPLKNYTIDGIR
ncbi:MAG: glycoside hydrolase family 3 protein [Planctomycetes bacterium]|nr:glycoside hydrolase family 3 protein [Planctomycetota bacterium]